MESSTPPPNRSPTTSLDGDNDDDDDDVSATARSGDSGTDISGNTWQLTPFSPTPAASSDGLFVYKNTYHLLPKSIGGGGNVKGIKFFGNEVEVLPPEEEIGGELDGLERLQVKVSMPRVSAVALRKLKALKELELSRVPPRPSAFTILSEIAGLKCLTKLAICHFSIRYLPPEIGSLQNLEELDLSFNKLKSLPNFIAELTALKVLKITNNKLEDLPSAISSLRFLKSLDLSNNRLTSLAPVKLASMLALQYLNLQFNRLSNSCLIPSWICCDMRGNGEDVPKGQKIQSLIMGSVGNVARSRNIVSHTYNGCSCSNSEASLNLKIHSTQKMKNGWKRRDSLQQRARDERLNFCRNKNSESDNEDMPVNMAEDDSSYNLLDVGEKHQEMKVIDEEEDSTTISSKSIVISKASDYPYGLKDTSMMLQDRPDENKIGTSKRIFQDDISCITTESSLDKDYNTENELEDSASSVYAISEVEVTEENPCETSKFAAKSKRHPDNDINTKPKKLLKPIDECSNLSYKYSMESFCSIDDHLPDGFYDAGRDQPFMLIKDYEQSLGVYSREVILLDREQDDELDAIVFSAQLLLSGLKRNDFGATEDCAVDDLLRASVLALFVSDCFGGCDRSASLMRSRRAVVSLKKEQPFICTCGGENIVDSIEASRQMNNFTSHFNFPSLCNSSLQLIKEKQNSRIVPIGKLQFGVCRHRAILMKYLCDRADPPIPCELVRGYLDYMPHAWNIVPIRKGNSWTRMIVDACYPANIKEERDPEYFCRYVPLSRLNISLENQNSSISGCSFPSVSKCKEIENTATSCIYYCKIGSVDAAAKVHHIDARTASKDEIRDFEYRHLGEVRMLGVLTKHRSIVDIYGHQLSSKWVPDGGNKEYRLMQSVILMEYVKGGSLKGYMEKLQKEGKKRVPIDLAFFVAREIACALVELHSKLIIHRDIKSENVLVDLDSKRNDDAPIVKLSDFDRSVPLHSQAHTCCIAHFGVHPPNVCVGTPSWMAPEVLQAMHQKNSYGLEVDIWSYGCLLLEMLTLQMPYQGLSDSEIFDLMQKKQRPRLTPELEGLWSLDKPTARQKLAITSDAEAEKMKLLVDLFYKCTRGIPAERPNAEQIYRSLCSLQPFTDAS